MESNRGRRTARVLRARRIPLGLALRISAGLGATILGGCASATDPVEACLVFSASDNLNLYVGEPHLVTVYVYPLSTPAGFEQARIENLLEGERPNGVLGPNVPITVSPGEERRFKELFPPATNQLGILADYYRAPGDPEGKRKHVVKARCGWSKTRLILSPRDIYPK